jgi:uncharacterized membrane protein
MNRTKHDFLTCFDPDYQDKCRKAAESIRSYWFEMWWCILPLIVALVNIPAGVYRSPVLLLYGALAWTALVFGLCELRVAAKRRSMLK